jgi:hypothetical protein
MNDNETKLTPKETLIREKMRAGLTRDQAIEVIANQDAHDEQLAEQEAEAAKATKKKGKAKDGTADTTSSETATS